MSRSAVASYEMSTARMHGVQVAHLLLLEQGDLAGLHAKVGIVLQQRLGARMGVARCHDGQRQLRAASRLGLKRQNRFYVYLQTIISSWWSFW